MTQNSIKVSDQRDVMRQNSKEEPGAMKRNSQTERGGLSIDGAVADITETSFSAELEKERLKEALNNNGYSNPTPELTTFGIKLGWVQGVLIPCLLNIWGVMLFLRISWIVAQAGIALTVLIILTSGVVCLITTMSLSAICTNGELGGGGVYYLVSRSLGAELGASVGIIFAFANAVAASMNTIGFCDSLNELLKSHGAKIVDNGMNDTRIIGAIALLVMCVICAVGMDWESKTQNFLIIVIVLAILNYMIGVCWGPRNKQQIAKGFVGISYETAKKNWRQDYRETEGVQYNLFSVFAMYFPAVTGVQAGANICGDLRNPATAIPKGTFLAVMISMTSYLLMAVTAGTGALRDASGHSGDLTHTELEACKPECDYGLHNNYEIMQLMSLWPPLIYGGCWAATLSTALTNLLSVPRLIQALGTDRIYPGLIFFSKPYGRHGEPYRGYVLTYCVSLMFLLIADLNTIAPLISNFYLASYALINFCTFHAAYVKSIGWRPTYHRFSKWISLVGFLMCLSIMMVISWVMALITTLIFMALYLLVVYTKPLPDTCLEASWGSSTEAQRYRDTVSTILHLTRNPQATRSYNPQVLVLAGKPYYRPALLDIGHLLTKQGSFMIVADLEPSELSRMAREGRMRLGEEWVASRNERALYVLLHGVDVESGLRALARSAGLGHLAPNLLLLGFRTKWTTVPPAQVATYVAVIRLAFEEGLSVAVLRAPPTSKPPRPAGELAPPEPSAAGLRPGEVVARTKLLQLMHSNSEDSLPRYIYGKHSSTSQDVNTAGSTSVLTFSPSEERHNMLLSYQPLTFDASKPVDAWWLYDDGGMNILLPYIIARRGFKEHRIFRIFALARNDVAVDQAERAMTELLEKFRIEYSTLQIIRGIDNHPTHASWELFQSIASRCRTEELTSDTLITENELKEQYSKTRRYLRIRDLLRQHSSVASFIVMTLPMPRKEQVSACLYMTWLEVLSAEMPPTLFVRGNETSVLDA